MANVRYPVYAAAYSDLNHFIFVHQSNYPVLKTVDFYPYPYRQPTENTVAVFKVKPKKSALPKQP